MTNMSINITTSIHILNIRLEISFFQTKKINIKTNENKQTNNKTNNDFRRNIAHVTLIASDTGIVCFNVEISELWIIRTVGNALWFGNTL